MTDSKPHTALLLIDVQNGCFSIPELRIRDSREFLSRVSALVSWARSCGTPVVYTQQIGPPDLFADGSHAGRIHSEVAPLQGELVVRKQESDAFLRSELQAELEKRGITDLIVCGMLSQFCVDATCRRAYGLGYRVRLVQDAHTTGDGGTLTAEQIIAHHNETLRPYATLTSTAEVCS